MNETNSSYRKALGDDESLKEFLAALAKFDHEFCDAMADGLDFTLRMEIHGDKGKLLHARISSDSFRRPRNGKRAKPVSRPLS